MAGDVSWWTVTGVFAAALILVLISDIPNHWGLLFTASRVGLAAILVATFFFPVRKGVLVLLVLALAGQDIVSSSDHDESFATSSIWQLRVGLVQPSWLIFGCLLVYLAKILHSNSWQVQLPRPVRIAAIWFATVPILTAAIYGGYFTEEASIEVIKDLKLAAMLVGSTVLFSTILRRNPEMLPIFLATFIGALLARHAVDLAYLFANYGPSVTAGVTRASEDSTKGTVVFLAYFGVMLASLRGRVILGSAIAICAVVLLAGYATRMIWITFLVGSLVAVAFVGARRTLITALLIGFVSFAGGWVLNTFSPEVAEVVMLRANTIMEGRDQERFAVSTDYNFVSRIDPIRYGEVLNILNDANDRVWHLWGVGYGGYYRDHVVRFPHNLKDSFPDYSLERGVFYSAHGFPSLVFLKHGLVGLVIISSLWIAPGLTLLRRFRSAPLLSGASLEAGTMLCLGLFLITAMLQLYWSGKGLLINGLLIALCFQYVRQCAALER